MKPIEIPRAQQDTAFTGERLVLGVGLDIEHEHFHRYVWASRYCEGKKVLDVASGEGYGSYILSQSAEAATGCDISAEAVSRATQNYSRPNLEFLEADCRKLPFDDETFDVVVSFETIEHIHEHQAFVEEVQRILKGDGVFICSTPEINEFNDLSQVDDNEFHVHEFETEEFQSLMQRHFKNVVLLGQSFAASSLIVPLQSRFVDFHHYHMNDKQVHSVANSMLSPTFLIAVCSSGNIPDVSASSFSSRISKTIVSELLIEKYKLMEEKSRVLFDLDLARHQSAILQDMINGYEESFSWRITKPVRLLSQRFSRVAAVVRKLLIPR